METTELSSWERLRELTLDGESDALDDYLGSLTGSEVVRALFRLSVEEQRELLRKASPTAAAEIIEDVPDAHAADLIEALPVGDAASILQELPSDEQADVLAEVESTEQEAILGQMHADAASDARELMSYPPDSAGGLMVREYLAYPAATSAATVLRKVTSEDVELSRYALQHAYVVDRQRRLGGRVQMRELVGVEPGTRIGTLASVAPVINVGADLATLRECFDEVEERDLPVTSDDGVLRGVLLRSDVEEALTQQAEEDHLKSQGIVGGEELRTMPLGQRAGRRLSWLSINIVLNIVAASVIAVFEETLTAVIALAVFLPIVSDMSGCSGNQAVAVSMRELTLGIVNAADVFRVWWQEMKVGLVNGAALGVLLGAAAWLWKGNPMLGAVVGGALALNTLIAVSIGGTVPLILKTLDVDPAVASGPVLTTVTDMCGFFLVLGIATLALPWL